MFRIIMLLFVSIELFSAAAAEDERGSPWTMRSLGLSVHNPKKSPVSPEEAQIREEASNAALKVYWLLNHGAARYARAPTEPLHFSLTTCEVVSINPATSDHTGPFDVMLPRIGTTVAAVLAEVGRLGRDETSPAVIECLSAKILALMSVNATMYKPPLGFVETHDCNYMMNPAFVAAKQKEFRFAQADVRLHLIEHGYWYGEQQMVHNLMPGDQLYAFGHPGCKNYYRGHHLICVGFNTEGKRMYIGFDPELFAGGPKILEEIQKSLVVGFLTRTSLGDLPEGYDFESVRRQTVESKYAHRPLLVETVSAFRTGRSES